jgi:hypothetical protein
MFKVKLMISSGGLKLIFALLKFLQALQMFIVTAILCLVLNIFFFSSSLISLFIADENYISTSVAPAQVENKGENPSRSSSTSSSSSDSGSSSSGNLFCYYFVR